MRTLFILIVFFSSLLGYGQSLDRQVIGSAGMHALAGDHQLSFTVGEAVINSASAASALLTQGFQQVDTTSYASVHPLAFGSPQLTAYPNPTVDLLNLRITGLLERGHVQVNTRIVDMSGKTVWKGLLPGTGGQIQVDHLAASTYMILVSTARGNVLHRIRFVKY